MKRILTFIVSVILLSGCFAFANTQTAFAVVDESANEQQTAQGSGDYIKWVDFNVPYEVMLKAYELDIKARGKSSFNFIEALAVLAVRNGNSFNTRRDIVRLTELYNKLESGGAIKDIYGKDKYFNYYLESYTAIFKEFIGEYTVPETGEKGYGLKNYHPFPKGFGYSHYDDFGSSRSYGYKRRHLGHDMMGGIGTPIAAVESGIVTDIGWNKYGGWRIGIRSFDKKRSYYYAHLRKNKPYADGLGKGSVVQAGQIIGYLGVTGYSTKENRNMKGAPHLHIGMQLIFDEVQKEGPKEIWIDMYQICKFLSHNRVEAVKDESGYTSKNLKVSASAKP